MAGHSKWANIKHRKAGQDAKRGKIFTKHIRAITVAAKLGGDDLDANPRLRTAVDKALAVNMTRDTINRAIKRGAGATDGDDMLEIRYEGYGTNGVAVIVDCLTDNRNRTVADVRHAFSKSGGNLGTEGSVAYQFQKRGLIHIAAADAQSNLEAIMEAAIESGAEDVTTDEDGSVEIVTDSEQLNPVLEAIRSQNFKVASHEVTFIADNTIKLDAEQSEKLVRLVDMLEDLDDVQNVYTNADLDTSLLD